MTLREKIEKAIVYDSTEYDGELFNESDTIENLEHIYIQEKIDLLYEIRNSFDILHGQREELSNMIKKLESQLK